MAGLVQTVRGYVDELLSLNIRQLLNQGVTLGTCSHAAAQSGVRQG